MEEYKKIVPVQFVADENSLKTLEMQVEGVVKGIKIDVDLPTKTDVKSLRSLEQTKEEEESQDSIASILQAQYESYSRIQEMKRHSKEYSQEQIEDEKAILDNLRQQTAELGTDGQLEVLDEKRRIAMQILELAQLDTKESKTKTKELKEQLKYLDENFKIESSETGSSIKESMSKIGGTFNLGSWISTLSTFKVGLVAGLVAVGAEFISKMKQTFDDAISSGQDAMNDFLDASRMSSSSTRQTMFTWGFNQQQAYGYNQAMSALGWSSLEDYMYSTDSEQAKFYATMTDFATQYSMLEQRGFFDDMLDYQIDQYKFEQEKKIRDVEFYNKYYNEYRAMEELKYRFRAGLMELLSPILKLFPKSSSVEANKAKADEVLSAYANNSSSYDQRKNYTVTMNNQFDVKSKDDAASITSYLENRVVVAIQ